MWENILVISFCSQWKWEWHPETILVLQPTMMKTRVAICNLSNFPFSQERQTWYFITWRLCWQLVCQLVTLPWLLHTTCRYVYWTVNLEQNMTAYCHKYCSGFQPSNKIFSFTKLHMCTMYNPNVLLVRWSSFASDLVHFNWTWNWRFAQLMASRVEKRRQLSFHSQDPTRKVPEMFSF